MKDLFSITGIGQSVKRRILQKSKRLQLSGMDLTLADIQFIRMCTSHFCCLPINAYLSHFEHHMVFSTHVEMFLRQRRLSLPRWSFLHARGDVSKSVAIVSALA